MTQLVTFENGRQSLNGSRNRSERKAKRPDIAVGASKYSAGSEGVAHADLYDGVELVVLGVFLDFAFFAAYVI